MALRLEIVSEHRTLVGDDCVREFFENGGTIGRSLQNDWILPDPDRYISGKHAAIDFKGGAYYLVDISTNGVYVNGDCEPLGKGNPRRLFNGDTIRMGDFEINVRVDEGESIVMPLDDTGSLPAFTDHAGSLVEEDPLKTGMLLLDEEALTGDDEFQSALFGGPVQTDDVEAAVEAAVETAVASSIADLDADLDSDLETDLEAELEQANVPSANRTTAASAKDDLVARDLLDTFLDGLGVDRSELHPDTDLSEVMRNAGEVLREFVQGTTQLLASRANLKNAFRLDQTTVLPRHNNPLKLAANTKDSIKQLLVGKEGEYLGPRDAVREVCRDLLFHQDAFLDAMNRSFLEFADRFDPDELEESFTHNSSSNFISKMFDKNKFWGMYRELYPILTEKGSGKFPQMYAEEFVKAYERQIADYKRLGGIDESLKSTVVMNESDIHAQPAISEDDLLEDQVPEETSPEITIAEPINFDDDPFDNDGPDRAEG
ncbi:MAG: type VI secretion system-associated FHA domain protein TagH [Pseudomonadota bacterium]